MVTCVTALCLRFPTYKAETIAPAFRDCSWGLGALGLGHGGHRNRAEWPLSPPCMPSRLGAGLTSLPAWCRQRTQSPGLQLAFCCRWVCSLPVPRPSWSSPGHSGVVLTRLGRQASPEPHGRPAVAVPAAGQQRPTLLPCAPRGASWSSGLGDTFPARRTGTRRPVSPLSQRAGCPSPGQGRASDVLPSGGPHTGCPICPVTEGLWLELGAPQAWARRLRATRLGHGLAARPLTLRCTWTSAALGSWWKRTPAGPQLLLGRTF